MDCYECLSQSRFATVEEDRLWTIVSLFGALSIALFDVTSQTLTQVQRVGERRELALL